MPRILFVAMSESVHTARWIGQIADLGWDIHLFPSASLMIHPQLEGITIHGFDIRPPVSNRGLVFAGACSNTLSWRLNRLLRMGVPAIESSQAYRLARTIDRIEPDIIHSLEMQHAGYLTLEARRYVKNPFPVWAYTPWGNDIFFFGQLSAHKDKIESVLAACDYYGPKSNRDIALGRAYGFKGDMLPVLPGNGGLETRHLRRLWQPGPPSARRVIMLKGYQGSMGRALVALRAIELCADLLKDYQIAVYSTGEAVRIKAELVSNHTGLPIQIIPAIQHEEMLKLYGRARISMGLSISDGVPNSMLEAMAMGALPIESNTSCADEWIEDNKTGFMVPPEDYEPLIEALRRAVTDDLLVDTAAEINAQAVQERADVSVIKPQVLSMYRHIASASGSRRGVQ
jgi:glycosyltransferase involved in cell wall biosynthesis